MLTTKQLATTTAALALGLGGTTGVALAADSVAPHHDKRAALKAGEDLKQAVPVLNHNPVRATEGLREHYLHHYRVARRHDVKTGRNIVRNGIRDSKGLRAPVRSEVHKADVKLRRQIRHAIRVEKRAAAQAKQANAAQDAPAQDTAPEAPKAAKSQESGGSTASSGLESIAACESGGDPSAVDSSGTYRGKYQFDQQTWESVGGSGDPAAASEGEQDKRAQQLMSQSGSNPWPVCGS